MTPRLPSLALVMDTNIILGMALGNEARANKVLGTVLAARAILVSARTREEATKVAAELGQRRPGVDKAVGALLRKLTIIDGAFYSDLLDPAAETLRLAVPSCNGSTADAHVLALAWASDSDIWSGDRDFAGTGWPSWSNANLCRALDGIGQG